MAVTREQWEQAAKDHGLELVAEPQCPECDGAGEVLQRSGYADPCSCEGAYRPHCPMSGETWAPGTMAWVRSDDYRRPVSAIAACGCGLCGERPARPGSDCCAECLESEPTMRGAELESVGGAL